MIQSNIVPKFGRLIVDRQQLQEVLGQEKAEQVNQELDALKIPVKGVNIPGQEVLVTQFPALKLLDGFGIDVQVTAQSEDVDGDQIRMLTTHLLWKTGGSVGFYDKVPVKDLTVGGMTQLFQSTVTRWVEELSSQISESFTQLAKGETLPHFAEEYPVEEIKPEQ